MARKCARFDCLLVAPKARGRFALETASDVRLTGPGFGVNRIMPGFEERQFRTNRTGPALGCSCILSSDQDHTTLTHFPPHNRAQRPSTWLLLHTVLGPESHTPYAFPAHRGRRAQHLAAIAYCPRTKITHLRISRLTPRLWEPGFAWPAWKNRTPWGVLARVRGGLILDLAPGSLHLRASRGRIAR